ncbi:hypothetical protein TrCOL_g58 [Triparma columacea]|uniref:Uncharacterized protein n=1 Tax=Triparma columacea TaxID=722753 RepID=A0A9W7GCM1_9STRA|nr:hypothetical protein TrCOL_g58 [Triparma columacea]
MPLASLPDDCLFIVSSYLSSPDLLLGFSPTCKACRWAALPSAALAAALPFASVPLHRRASLVVRGEIAREESAALSPVPKARGAHKLSDFAFLVALDEGRAWEEAKKEGREARLNYVEVSAEIGSGSIFTGIKVPIPPAVGPDLWPQVEYGDDSHEYGGVHIVVVDKATGQARKLMDGPHVLEYCGVAIMYKYSDMPGQEYGAASVKPSMVTFNPGCEGGPTGADQEVIVTFFIDLGDSQRWSEMLDEREYIPPVLAGMFRSVELPAALDEAVDATVPFAHGMSDEASREAYGQLAREESAVLSAPAVFSWSGNRPADPPLPTVPKRELAGFAFLVAFDEGRTWEKVKEEGGEAQLRFVEATAEVTAESLSFATIALSVPPAAGPAVWSCEGAECSGVHVVVVDRRTGRARKLVDAPHAEDKGTYFMDMPGQECSAVETSVCMSAHDPSEAVHPEYGRSGLDPPKGADQELVLCFDVSTGGGDSYALGEEGIARALAGMFA